MKRFVVSVLVFVVLLGAAGPVFAHAELLASSPEANAALDTAPATVELSFSEAVEPSFSTITVLDVSGANVDNGDSRVDPADPTRLTVSLRALPDGVYTVSWKALSAVDGHVTTGAYPFAVGDVDAAALAAAEQASRQVRLSIGEVIARWLTYLSAAMLAGGLVFRLLVWQPALRSANAPDSVASALPVRKLVVLAVIGFLAASLLTLLVHAGQAAGAEFAAPWTRPVSNVLFHTRWGALWLARLALLLAAAGLLIGTPRPRDLWVALGAAVFLLFGISLGSHAAAEPRPLLPVLADWIHLITASAWVGGLIYFAAGLWALRRTAGNGVGLTRHLLPRFSALALTSVAALSLTGTYMAVLRLGAWDALTGTLYGRTLLVKLALAAPMLLLGASNLLLVTPRLRSATQNPQGSRVANWFRRSVTSEVTLGAAVLLTVGLFTALPPARIASSAPEIRRTATADDLSLTLTIAPGRVGLNTFALRAMSGAQPVTGAGEVLLRFTPNTAGLAPSEAVLEEQGNGVYSTRGAYLSLPDAWQIQSVVRREGVFDAFANYDVTVASGAAPVAAFPWHRVTGGLLLVSALLLAFTANRLFLRPSGKLGLSPRALAPALALFAAGVVVFYQAPPGRPGASIINPVPPNASSVAIGRELYTTNCVPCHGPTGKGDGPVGLTLNPRPADLSLHAVPGVHTDGQLWLWVTNGFEGSVMPAFKEVLSDEQRWHVVNYVRTLAPK